MRSLVRVRFFRLVGTVSAAAARPRIVAVSPGIRSAMRLNFVRSSYRRGMCRSTSPTVKIRIFPRICAPAGPTPLTYWTSSSSMGSGGHLLQRPGSNIMPVVHTLEADLADAGVGAGDRFAEICAQAGHAEHAATIRQRLAMFRPGAGLEHEAVFCRGRLVQPLDQLAGRVL